MEWLESLRGETIGLDTAPLIYLIEQNPKYLSVAHAFFEAMARGDFEVVTSTITILEVMVQPLRAGNTALAKQYRDILLQQEYLSVQSISAEIAEKAAELRAQYNFRAPDAIQLATAICAGASHFLTNDAQLVRTNEIRTLLVEELTTL